MSEPVQGPEPKWGQMPIAARIAFAICWVLVIASLAGMALTMNPAWLLPAFVASFVRFLSGRWIPPLSKKETGILLALALLVTAWAMVKALAMVRQGPNWAP
jgi:hypothetical protein